AHPWAQSPNPRAPLDVPDGCFAQRFRLVRRKGLEPLQELPHWNLNPARLPIPPPSLGWVFAACSPEALRNLDHPAPAPQLVSYGRRGGQGLPGAHFGGGRPPPLF